MLEKQVGKGNKSSHQNTLKHHLLPQGRWFYYILTCQFNTTRGATLPLQGEIFALDVDLHCVDIKSLSFTTCTVWAISASVCGKCKFGNFISLNIYVHLQLGKSQKCGQPFLIAHFPEKLGLSRPVGAYKLQVTRNTINLMFLLRTTHTSP